MAVAYIEYCNYAKGTKWSDLRRSHGYEQPHKVKYWCLGNEMDGPWQIGRLTGREYGRKARDIAQQARVIDPDVQLIACGSSSAGMQTYLEWDREVLEECYDMVDGLSLHAYYGNSPDTSGGKTERYLAMNLDMERHIREVTAVCDYVQGLKRSPKRLWLSFDEWNVWYRANSGDHTNGHGKFAPRLLEEIYNLEDALLVGGLLNTLLRQSDRVRVGCLAQIVNVIAPLMTSDKGILRQSTYLPVRDGAEIRGRPHPRPAGRMRDLPRQGRGIARHATRATWKSRSSTWSRLTTPSANASPCSRSIAICPTNASSRSTFEDITPSRVLAAETVTGPDLKAFNTFESPNQVVATKLDVVECGREDDGKAPGAFLQRRSSGRIVRSRHDPHAYAPRRTQNARRGRGHRQLRSGACPEPHAASDRAQVHYFGLGRVRLGDGPFLAAQNSTKTIYCSSSPTACCELPHERRPRAEGAGLRRLGIGRALDRIRCHGHTLGHYLTAAACMYRIHRR